MEAPLCNLCISLLYERDTSIQGTFFLIPRASPEWRLHCTVLSLKFQVVGLMARVQCRWGIQQLGILFGSTVFPSYFPTEVDGGHVHNSCKKFPGPPVLTVRFVSVIYKCHIIIMTTETDYYFWV